MGLARLRLGRELEVALPGDGGLLAPGVLIAGEKLVFQDEGVSLLW